MCAHTKTPEDRIVLVWSTIMLLVSQRLKDILVVSQYETLSPIYWFLVLKLEHWKHQKFSEG